jgi:addiction module RelE/StbE family toxin
MWNIWESRSVLKIIKKIPNQVLERYEFWKNIIENSGPEGLRKIKGFKDEQLKGVWKGYRSSRLNLQYRVIYKVVSKDIYIFVEEITPHNYRRKK